MWISYIFFLFFLYFVYEQREKGNGKLHSQRCSITKCHFARSAIMYEHYRKISSRIDFILTHLLDFYLV